MFNPGWKMTIFVFVIAPVLFLLGHWQLDREQEKIVLQSEYDTRASAPALPVDTVDWTRKDLGFLKIVATGNFVNEHAYLLDNKIHEGQVGYEILTPFDTSNGETFLVNRGWIAQGATRKDLPKIPYVDGVVTIQGSIYVPLEEAFVLNTTEELEVSEGPKVIQTIQMDELSKDLAKDIAPYTVRLLENSIGLTQANWQAVNMLPEKHRAYAVQWFAMLFALITMFIYFGFKNPRLNQNREL